MSFRISRAGGFALGLSLLAPAWGQSGSSLTLYGLIDTSLRQASNMTTGGGRQTSLEDGIFTGSRLGVRGREDLGGGWSAAFNLETGMDPSTGTTTLGTSSTDYGVSAAPMRMWGREVHVSLRNSWAGVTLGRQYTVAHALSARFQPLGNPNSAVYSLFSSHHIARQDNVMRLDAKGAGLEWVASATWGEQANSDSANGSWALGVGLTRSDWAAAAYAQQMKNLTGAETRKILGLGGNLKLSPTVTLFGGAMQRTAAVSLQKNRVLTLGANVVLNSTSTLSVAAFDDQQSGSAALKGQRRVAWASVNYAFSRRTDIYGTIDHNRVGGGYARPAFMAALGTQTGLALGLRHRF